MLFENEVVKALFKPENGGFPSEIYVKHALGEMSALRKPGVLLNIELSDGRTAVPFLPDGFTVVQSSIDGAERIQFDGIRFKDQHGVVVDDFRLSLRYEFWDDGTVFVRTYFTVDAFFDRPGIRGFTLDVPLDLSTFDTIQQPSGMAPNMDAEGKLKAFSDYAHSEIIPSVNFNCSKSCLSGMYFEVFMEDNETLSGDANDAGTTITWEDRCPTISWNFQTREMAPPRDRPWEWSAQWGWLFSAPPTRRRLPPMRMYHLLDYFDYRVPTLAQLEEMASAGADVIILHETWRLDIVSGSFPYDRDGLREFIAQAHKRHIRIALYIRGHGDTGATEDSCDWFGAYLNKNYDGLYMDFGGARNGRYAKHRQDGKYLFRAHYLKMRRIRKEIGKHGLLYAHSGCLTSAVGLTPNLIDAYVAGEGESGALTKSRFSHECLSGSYVTTGSMWTAAFPHYGESRIAPFMAVSGQYPHMPLGVQFRSSSLAHPAFPGINDVYLRPLWKLWGAFHGQKDIVVFNDFNSHGVFTHSDAETGANLMITREGRVALLILANFRKEQRCLSTKVNWESTGFSPKARHASAYLLAPTIESPGTPNEWKDFGNFEADVEAYGCVGFLIGDPEALGKPVNAFARPYPPRTEEAMKHSEMVENQKSLRKASSVPRAELFIKAEVPPPPNTLVCAMAFYNVVHEIGTFDQDGAFTLLGYLSVEGVEKNKPRPEDIIWAGCSSPWIALHDLLQTSGKHRVGIRSFSLSVGSSGAYFHSLIELLVAPRPDANAQGAYRLTFMNEVEPERETLHFDVNLKGRPASSAS